jgi:hypothetical protein
MFVLEFHKSVANVMEWTKDAPPSKFLTFHQTVMEERNHPTTTVDYENLVLRTYIQNHYPKYFNTKISVGEKTAKNFNRIMQRQKI